MVSFTDWPWRHWRAQCPGKPALRLDEEMLSLNDALDKLSAADERLAQVVEMRYFAGLSELEIAELLQRSERSIRRDWQKARLFLLSVMSEP